MVLVLDAPPLLGVVVLVTRPRPSQSWVMGVGRALASVTGMGLVALVLAAEVSWCSGTVVVLLPDSGRKYLSTDLWE